MKRYIKIHGIVAEVVGGTMTDPIFKVYGRKNIFGDRQIFHARTDGEFEWATEKEFQEYKTKRYHR